jgi:hypothetical protein
MLKFHVCVHGSSQQASGPLEVTFDSALQSLAQLPRMFIEPDGAFVWTGATPNGQAWQVDGNLVDQGDVLAYVELKGNCPTEQLDKLLPALGWPQTKLSFQLPMKGLFIDEDEFRRLASTPAGAQ